MRHKFGSLHFENCISRFLYMRLPWISLSYSEFSLHVIQCVLLFSFSSLWYILMKTTNKTISIATTQNKTIERGLFVNNMCWGVGQHASSKFPLNIPTMTPTLLARRFKELFPKKQLFWALPQRHFLANYKGEAANGLLVAVYPPPEEEVCFLLNTKINKNPQPLTSWKLNQYFRTFSPHTS